MEQVLKNFKKEILAAVIFLAMYIPAFVWMWDRWFARDSYYSHGILIPFVSGYLIWQLKDELKLIKREESVWGMRLIVVGVFIHLVSSVLRIYFSSGFSMLIVLVGLLLHFFGAKIVKKIAFPLAFLVFMVPLPMVAIANISFKLKMVAAHIAAILLNGIGLHAVREGSVIKMPHAYVVVDDVCSGLRSLISLTALGAIFSYWMEASFFKRLLLFLTTIPIAIITNVCRVMILAFISEIWGAEYATGMIHDATGFMVFALAFILLFAAGKLIE